MEYCLNLFDEDLSNWVLVSLNCRVSNHTIKNLIITHKESISNFEKTFMDFIIHYNNGRIEENPMYDKSLFKQDLSNLFSSFTFKLENDHFEYRIGKMFTLRYKLSLDQCLREYKIKKVLDI